MGGSGGGGGSNFFGGRTPEEMIKALRSAQQSTSDDEYDSQVNVALSRLLARYNDRDVNKIDKYLETVKTAIESDIEGVVNLRFGGSVSKHTYVDGISDVDSLVIINQSELAEATPQQVLDFFAARLRERLPKSAITKGTLAVTVAFADATVQLLPALKTSTGYKIASSDGKSWSHIAPDRFSKALSETNDKLGGKLIPTIKLAKAIMSSLPDDWRPTGYHTESLALGVFADYSGPNRPRHMLKHFFETASVRVLSPIKDVTGQSQIVDDNLGAPKSRKRQLVSNAMDRIARKMKNIDGSRSVEQWLTLFDNAE